MPKVSFGEAASQAGIHFNTLRNWRKAGKLKTAEKVLENGRELWTVELEEVEDLTRQSRQDYHDNKVGDIDGANVYNTPQGRPDNDHNSEPPDTPAVAATTALAGFEQSLALMRDTFVKPLETVIERQAVQLDKQAARLEEMATEVGALREKVRRLEEDRVTLEKPVTAPEAPQSPPPTQPANITPEPEKPVDAPQQAGKRRRGWLERLFGG